MYGYDAKTGSYFCSHRGFYFCSIRFMHAWLYMYSHIRVTYEGVVHVYVISASTITFTYM